MILRERGRAETVKEKQLLAPGYLGKFVSRYQAPSLQQPNRLLGSHRTSVKFSSPSCRCANSGHVQLFAADMEITPLYRLKQRLVLRLFCGHHNASTHLP